MKNNIFIIGSNSFSGSNFINFLLDKKLFVVGISRSKENKNIYLKYKKNKNIKNFKFYKADINKNFNLIKKLLNKYKPSIIINFSSQGMVNESWKSPLDWYITNFISTIKIVNFLLKKKYLKKFINFTTPEVYGNNKKKLSEEEKFNPSTPYALSRASADTHMKLMNKYKRFPIIFTRAANVYGPHQQLYRIVPKTIILLIRKKKVPIDGSGLTFRSFIHINDVNEALYKILQHGKTGETYHISTSNYISIIDLVKKIIKILEKTKNFNKYIYYKKDRIGKDEFYKLTSKKIIKKLKWKPTITLGDGINDVVEWIQKNYKFLAKNKLTYQHKK
tara:strand:+ start:1463 stop:2461 length:999 start_codon:yes stop_codon:yes gene_type:complete